MKIHHIHISNLRHFQDCRIDFYEDQTIIIGANDSGKTSVITPLIWFSDIRDHCSLRGNLHYSIRVI